MTLPIISPRVCIDENLVDTTDGLAVAPHSVPRCVIDQVAFSGGSGPLPATLLLPGRLLVDWASSWTNDTPVDQVIMIRVTRGPRSIVVSNPNAIQFRDRWTWAINASPDAPVTSDILNGQVGCAVDLGTNSVAEPNPGKMWMWVDAHTSDEWISPPLSPGNYISVKYRMYVWTPPPWSDNANRNLPEHTISSKYTHMQLWAFPQPDTLVSG